MNDIIAKVSNFPSAVMLILLLSNVVLPSMVAANEDLEIDRHPISSLGSERSSSGKVTAQSSHNKNMQQSANDVLKAIEAMKLERFVVGGHSIGGMIAIELAGQNVPGMIGSIPIEGWTHHTVVKTAFGGTVVANLTTAEETHRLADRVRGRSHLSEEELRAIGTIWREWDGYDCLERSTIPILEIWGDRGKPRPNREALRIADRDNIEIAWITDASHLVLLENPAEVARLVLEFLEKGN